MQLEPMHCVVCICRFAVLKTCWEHRPEDRPSFTQLTETLVEYWEQEHGYINPSMTEIHHAEIIHVQF